MKYFIGLIGLTSLLFAGLIAYGRSLPQTFIFETSTSVMSDIDIVYEQIVALDNIRLWAPYLANLNPDDVVVTGPNSGGGQVISWAVGQRPFGAGVQEVLAVSPPYFVQSRFLSPPYEGSIIYALSESLPNDDVTVLVRLDIDAGRFPFFDRIKLRMKQDAVNAELSRSLERINIRIENG